uniref:ABC-2 type transporter n=1 Tax=Porphyridium aerugineum TaxID=2792 RepID=UPI001FCDDF42|nr:ABC-2 type transporter [Porphyridium aerugineum]UNJ17899.1 ABC-2 type transporter [Porphyridium aerugineum]
MNNSNLDPQNLLVPILRIKKDNYLCFIDFIEESYGIIERLFIQIKRRSSTLIAGTLQPLLWFFLFGALFENFPFDIPNNNTTYSQFLSAGIIVFTAFSGALNAGLSIIFDREFGFLNRLLVYPLRSRLSILLASIFFIVLISLAQAFFLLLVTSFKNNNYHYFEHYLDISLIIFLITIIVSLVSINLAFVVPGHIEFLAFILITNLPILFSSTALAPINLMPRWLKIIALLNPLTYAIEFFRSIDINRTTVYIDSSKSLAILFSMDIIAVILTYIFFQKKYK